MIFSLVRKTVAAFRRRYPWFRSGNFMVVSYRYYLESIAQALSQGRSVDVKTRFNRRARCAELYAGDQIILQIEVWGGVLTNGSDMYVRGRLSKSEQTLFDDIYITKHFATA